MCLLCADLYAGVIIILFYLPKGMLFMNKKLQIFVSSTYKDLMEERQAAVEAILDAGHIPAGMELFKAGNESQLKTIYKWIDESDVYMLILGGRYGSVAAEAGKSYTQLEYEYALDKGIPPDKYQSFKALVMSKIIREVDDCKDIQISIHTTLNDFMNEYDLVGWKCKIQGAIWQLYFSRIGGNISK